LKSNKIDLQSVLHSLIGPESHVSSPTNKPSPHISLQISGTPPEHFHPIAFEVQSTRQPGLDPASQVSFPTLNPSPHIGLQNEGFVSLPIKQFQQGNDPEQSDRQFLTLNGVE